MSVTRELCPPWFLKHVALHKNFSPDCMRCAVVLKFYMEHTDAREVQKMVDAGEVTPAEREKLDRQDVIDEAIVERSMGED